MLAKPAASDDDLFAALADPTRRAILDRLLQRPLAVNELAAGFRQSRPAISKHLRILRDADLVREQRQGRERVYRLQPERLRQIADWILPYRAFWQTSLTRLKQHLEQDP